MPARTNATLLPPVHVLIPFVLVILVCTSLPSEVYQLLRLSFRVAFVLLVVACLQKLFWGLGAGGFFVQW
ncbi:hypothetical protein EG328_006199 [Venturia inaequalis]|uniref:Uncharacterized protein n=1 Tax=Venturia inaequalis TaxID=5025 RepID=A0A8H3UJD0_VENIN|nr:hypothetical protein EG328_006199 [Venturia inaequalis]